MHRLEGLVDRGIDVGRRRLVPFRDRGVAPHRSMPSATAISATSPPSKRERSRGSSPSRREAGRSLRDDDLPPRLLRAR